MLDLPDTSIADTTTEDLNTSAVSEPASPPQSKQPDKERSPEPVPPAESLSETKSTPDKSESTEQVDKVPDKETPTEQPVVTEEEKMDVQVRKKTELHCNIKCELNVSKMVVKE